MSFTVIPAIDMRGGKCVRLVEGDFDRETVFGDDPVEVVDRFAGAGATRLHLVDLDGARAGRPEPAHLAVVRAAVARGLDVEVGGGVRDMDAIATYLDEVGARWVILGTAAVRRPELVAAAAERFGDRIIVGIDARDGMVAVKGWLETSATEATTLARTMATAGAAAIIYTDIRRDGTGRGPNIEATLQVAEASGLPVIASGGVHALSDLKQLAAHAPRIAGAVVGRALYTGDVELKAALALTARTA